MTEVSDEGASLVDEGFQSQAALVEKVVMCLWWWPNL
jgi:hypothetical protein